MFSDCSEWIVSHSLENHPLLALHWLFGHSLVYACERDVVPELAKGSRQNPGTLVASLGITFAALFDISDPLM